MRLIVHRSKAEQQSSREAKGKKKKLCEQHTNARWLQYTGFGPAQTGGLNTVSTCKRIIWTIPTDTSRWAGQTKAHSSAHLPHVYDPSHCSESAEGTATFWQQVSSPDHVLLQLASNDSAFPEHICSDRWCKRTRITSAASEKLLWNANVVWRRVKQGKSGSVSAVWLPHTEWNVFLGGQATTEIPYHPPPRVFCMSHCVLMCLSTRGWTPLEWRKTSYFSLDTCHPAPSVLKKCVRWELTN